MKGNYKMDTNVQQISSDVNTDTPPASHDVGKHPNTTTNYDMSLFVLLMFLTAYVLGIASCAIFPYCDDLPYPPYRKTTATDYQLAIEPS
jgi:hypothetical protein